MARKYRRDSSGRFAGGGGTAGTGTKMSASGGGARPKAAAGQRQIPRNGSVAQKRANPSGQRFRGAKKAAKGVGKFIKKNPEVLGLAISAGLAGKMQHDIKQRGKLLDSSATHIRNVVADKRGIGSKRPGEGLKRSGRTMRGAYKIRSR